MDIISLLLIFIALELFESYWQKANSLHGLIQNNYYIFSKNIFIYFSLHVTFFYTIFLAYYLHNFNFWMLSILGVKFLDIAFKLSMMKKLSEGNEIEDVMPVNIQMTPIFRYMNVIIYPLTFIFATGLI